jgi:hypothetical protein
VLEVSRGIDLAALGMAIEYDHASGMMSGGYYL